MKIELISKKMLILQVKFFQMQINVQEYSWQIILNPCAMSHKSGKFWSLIEQKLQSQLIKYEYHVPELLEDAKHLIAQLCKDGFRHFMVIGGDGTFNNFINGIMLSGINPEEIFIIPIPLGTGNDWIRTHFKKNNFKYTMDFISTGNFSTHDVGLVEVLHDEIVIDSRYFINISGFGFDAEIIKNTSEKKPVILPAAAYLFSLITTLLRQKSTKISIKANEFVLDKPIFSLAIGIGQFNGNGMKQCPESIPNDHLFDVIVIEDVKKFKVIKNVKNLYDGSHVSKLNEITMYRTAKINIKSQSILRGEVEGELLTLGDYKVSCIPANINILSELWN